MENKKYMLKVKEILESNKKIYWLGESSQSGMSGKYKLFVTENNEIKEVTRYFANVLNIKRTKDFFIRVRGCGFDRVHDILYRASRKVLNSDNLTFNYTSL